MLVPFVIDVDSLEPDQSWSPATLRACHADILELWNRVGLLVHDGPRFDQSRLMNAILALPPKQKGLWLAGLKHFPLIPCSTGWSGSVTLATAPYICGNAVLALVDNLHAEIEFEIPEDEDEIIVCPSDGQEIDVCRVQSSRRAKVVREAEALSQLGIEESDGYQDIWSSRFRSLAATSCSELKQVTIVDRFAMERHFNHSNRQHLSGFQRFLNLLDSDAGGPRRVTLFSAWSGGLKDINAGDVSREIEEILEHLPRQMIDQIVVLMVANRDYGAVTADRYVRLGKYVWELGHGLEAFEEGTARQWATATFKPKDRAHECIEKELRNLVIPHPIKVKS